MPWARSTDHSTNCTQPGNTPGMQDLVYQVPPQEQARVVGRSKIHASNLIGIKRDFLEGLQVSPYLQLLWGTTPSINVQGREQPPAETVQLKQGSFL